MLSSELFSANRTSCFATSLVEAAYRQATSLNGLYALAVCLRLYALSSSQEGDARRNGYLQNCCPRWPALPHRLRFSFAPLVFFACGAILWYALAGRDITATCVAGAGAFVHGRPAAGDFSAFQGHACRGGTT